MVMVTLVAVRRKGNGRRDEVDVVFVETRSCDSRDVALVEET